MSYREIDYDECDIVFFSIIYFCWCIILSLCLRTTGNIFLLIECDLIKCFPVGNIFLLMHLH